MFCIINVPLSTLTFIRPNMKTNIQKKEIWLDEAYTRFITQGLEGISIGEISKTIGVAKSSLYHYFGSKDNYLEELFQKWMFNGTTRIWNEVKEISDPIERMEKLIKIVLKTNIEEEIFYFQMRSASTKSDIAKKYLEKSDKIRGKIALGFFTEMGYDRHESVATATHFIRYFIGTIDTNIRKQFSEGEINQYIKDIKYILRIDN